jgi:hypothetical protein
MPPHFEKAFLKGDAYYRTRRRWFERKDTIAVKLKKTAFILSSLEEVDENCLEEHETHYSCPGFFKILIQLLTLELKTHSEPVLPDLSEFELEKYLEWRLTAGEIFSTNLYRKFFRLPE